MFVLLESVLLPGIVVNVGIELVSLHALLEEAHADLVVGFLLELEGSAVGHEVVELLGHSLAELFECGLELLLLDILILFVLGLAWKSLPRKLAFEEVEQDMADGL